MNLTDDDVREINQRLGSLEVNVGRMMAILEPLGEEVNLHRARYHDLSNRVMGIELQCAKLQADRDARMVVRGEYNARDKAIIGFALTLFGAAGAALLELGRFLFSAERRNQ